MFTPKILSVKTKELNSEECSTFEAFEFDNGLVMVVGESSNDWFFENRELIEACGNAVVVEIQEVGDTDCFTAEYLKESFEGCEAEFGSIPSKCWEMLGG